MEFDGSVVLIAYLAMIASIGLAQDKPQSKQSPKKGWHIIREAEFNDCILAKIGAGHPKYTKELGTYENEQQGKAALEEFKKKDDPDKPGYEMCSNK